MLSIIRTMNKSFKVLVVIAVICFSFVGCSSSDAISDIHESPKKAIMYYLNEERSQVIDYNEIEEAILCKYNFNNHCYYLMADIFDDNNEGTLKVYVLEMFNKGSGYFCEKATADFSFDLTDTESGKMETPFIEYVAPMNDVYVHIGKIYNTDYIAYYNGEILELYRGGMFFYMTNEADVETLVVNKACSTSKSIQ